MTELANQKEDAFSAATHEDALSNLNIGYNNTKKN